MWRFKTPWSCHFSFCILGVDTENSKKGKARMFYFVMTGRIRNSPLSVVGYLFLFLFEFWCYGSHEKHSPVAKEEHGVANLSWSRQLIVRKFNVKRAALASLSYFSDSRTGFRKEKVTGRSQGVRGLSAFYFHFLVLACFLFLFYRLKFPWTEVVKLNVPSDISRNRGVGFGWLGVN
jgi:hypothetical protein